MARGRGALRIIGGRWRNTRIPVAAAAGLRPTSDRVRETLFNWLAPRIDGAVCLDLFAGTGALAFEAASRGAGAVVAVDRAPERVAAMGELRERLDANSVTLHRADAVTWLEGNETRFDIVFLDPPFDNDLLAPCLERLTRVACDADTEVYIERPLDGAPLPACCECLREGRTREVHFGLYRLRPAA